MLPHFVGADVAHVLTDLRPWASPSSRLVRGAPRVPFSVLRRSRIRGRRDGAAPGAQEPWNVLGETGASATARYCASSIERLQVKLTTGDPDRYVVACNRRRVPLRETASAGVAVGGVRFKASRKPAMAMQPTVPVHAPLVLRYFRRMERSRARRLRLSRRPSRRPQLRYVPRQQQRGGGAPPRAAPRRAATPPAPTSLRSKRRTRSFR